MYWIRLRSVVGESGLLPLLRTTTWYLGGGGTRKRAFLRIGERDSECVGREFDVDAEIGLGTCGLMSLFELFVVCWSMIGVADGGGDQFNSVVVLENGDCASFSLIEAMGRGRSDMTFVEVPPLLSLLLLDMVVPVRTRNGSVILGLLIAILFCLPSSRMLRKYAVLGVWISCVGDRGVRIRGWVGEVTGVVKLLRLQIGLLKSLLAACCWVRLVPGEWGDPGDSGGDGGGGKVGEAGVDGIMVTALGFYYQLLER